MLEAAGLKGHRIGGAQISPRHANFIENAEGATTADALALMAEARRRAREQFGVELEHEVALLGDIELPPWARRSTLRGGEVGAVAKLADAVVLRLPRARGVRGELAQLLPSWRIARDRVRRRARGRRRLRRRAAERALRRRRRSRSAALRPPSRREVRDALRPLEGESLLRARPRHASPAALAAIPSVRAATLRPRVPAHPARRRRRRAAGRGAAARPGGVARLGARAGDPTAQRPRLSSLPRIWVPTTVERGGRRHAGRPARRCRAVRRPRPWPRGSDRCRPRVARRARPTDELTLVLAAGHALSSSRTSEDLALKLAVARRVLLALEPNVDGWPAYVDLTVPGRPVVGYASSQVVSET